MCILGKELLACLMKLEFQYVPFHLGENEFLGALPQQIGKVPLVVFNISMNRFSGEIPTEIGNIRCLQNLDLSYNNCFRNLDWFAYQLFRKMSSILSKSKEKSKKRCSILTVPDSSQKKSEEPSKRLCVTPNNSELTQHSVAEKQKVLETLATFRDLYEKVSSEWEICKKSGREPFDRCDIPIKVAGILKQQSKWMHTTRIIGAVPGVDVGARFEYRAEMSVIGLHSIYWGRVDCAKKDGVLLAVSIVVGERQGDEDYVEAEGTLIYCGQGNKKQLGSDYPADQKLERGNLALSNSLTNGNSVRVIYDHNVLSRKGLRIFAESRNKYVYDGLYKVIDKKKKKGKAGNQVFEFKLKKMGGQEKTFNLKEERYLIIKDLSAGLEHYPVPVYNIFDSDRPGPFRYILGMHMNYPIPLGCRCTGNCRDIKNCLCILKSGEIAFNEKGLLQDFGRSVIFECGPSCDCSYSCHNRVTQKGTKVSFQITKTQGGSWAVRSRDCISKGQFVCEFLGEIVQKELESTSHFCIGRECFVDATRQGNISRFMRPSPNANLSPQRVLFDHENKSTPHFMLFASHRIAPKRELTYSEETPFVQGSAIALMPNPEQINASNATEQGSSISRVEDNQKDDAKVDEIVVKEKKSGGNSAVVVEACSGAIDNVTSRPGSGQTKVYVPTNTAKVASVYLEKQSSASDAPSVPEVSCRRESSPSESQQLHEVENRSIYVRNLPFEVTVAEVEAAFKKFGPIKPGGIQVISQKDLGRCFGFVEFLSSVSMNDAIQASRVNVGDRQAVVEMKKTTSRGGGGRGRLYSGRGGLRFDNFRGRGNFSTGGGGGGRGDARNEYSNRGSLSGRGRGLAGRGGDGYQRGGR